jgi:hypothetical protein
MLPTQQRLHMSVMLFSSSTTPLYLHKDFSSTNKMHQTASLPATSTHVGHAIKTLPSTTSSHRLELSVRHNPLHRQRYSSNRPFLAARSTHRCPSKIIYTCSLHATGEDRAARRSNIQVPQFRGIHEKSLR